MNRNKEDKRPLMAYEAYIFDLDGTLADTMPAHYLAWLEVTGKYGLELSEDRFYSLGGMPTPRILAMLSQEQNISLDPDVAAQEKEEAFLRHLDQVEPIEAVVEVVREQHGKVPLAVATGALRWVMERILSDLDLTHYFEAFVSSEDTARHKPYPDVFLEAARRLEVSPQRCCVYEDADLGIQAAQAAGMDVVDVRDFHTPRRITASA